MYRRSRFALLAAGLIVSLSAVRGQAILLGQPQVTLNAAPGATSAVQTLSIQTTVTALPFTIAFTPLTGGNWLSMSQAGGTLPANILMSANAGTLSAGTYTGIITVTAPGAANSPLGVPVTLIVGSPGAGTISAMPTTLSFFGTAGGPNPVPQNVTINSAGGAINITASSATTNSYGWLSVSSQSGTAPASLTVSAGTLGLPAGIYFGAVTVTPSSGPPVVIPVTLTLTTSAALNLTATALQFYYQTGGAYPPSQNINLTTDGSLPLSFQLAKTTAADWLTYTPGGSTTPQTVVIAANPANLAPGTYTANISVTTISQLNPVQNIAVTLTVSGSPLLTLSTPPAPFNFQAGGSTPSPQSVTVGSTSGAIDFLVTASTTSGNWFVVSPQAGTTPKTISVGVNPGSIAPGSYDGLVTVTAAGVGNSPQAFPVRLNITSTQTLAASPQALNFSYQAGVTSSIPQQAVAITSGGVPTLVSVAFSATTCGNWLFLSTTSATTPATLNVGVDVTGLTPPRVCTGTINIGAAGSTATVQVPVTLNISNDPLLLGSPLRLSVQRAYNEVSTTPLLIALGATNGGALRYTATPVFTSGVSWLSVAPQSGNTPAPLSVFVNSAGLNPGTYNSGISITSAGLPASLTIPVTLTVTPTATAAVIPSSISFVQSSGGSTPAPQQLAVTAGSAVYPFTVRADTPGVPAWLFVSPLSASTPATLNVSVNAGSLPAGNYSGTLTVTMPGASNSPLVVPVALSVLQSPGISASQSTLTFVHQLSTTHPGDQTLNLSTTGTAVPFTASASTRSSGNWLSVSPASGTAPAALTISVNPAGLAIGTYNGQISAVAPGAIGSPIIVPVTLIVQATPPPSIDSITSAASYAKGAIAVGEIVTIKGSALGPVTPSQFAAAENGGVNTTRAGTRVLFDGFAAPILYTSLGQINAIVPYEILGRTSVQLQVDYLDRLSQAVTVPLLAAVPGIFTADSSGAGQGSILNQDSSVNSASNPAAAGSIIQIFGTGEGQTDPAGVTGSLTGSVLRKPVASVTATVGGIGADVLYAGAAPQSVLGLFQVNVRIPNGVSSGAATVVINVGGAGSQDGVTVAVK